MENNEIHKGKSIIDRLLNLKECHEKIFIFNINGKTYNLDTDGEIKFCSYIDEIKGEEEGAWSPLYMSGADNPWGVTILNIRTEDPPFKKSTPIKFL